MSKQLKTKAKTKKIYSKNPSAGKLCSPNCGLFSTMPEAAEEFSKLKPPENF